MVQTDVSTIHFLKVFVILSILCSKQCALQLGSGVLSKMRINFTVFLDVTPYFTCTLKVEAARVSVSVYWTTRRHITSSSWICSSVRNRVQWVEMSWNSWIISDKQTKRLRHSHVIGLLTFAERIHTRFFLETSGKDIPRISPVFWKLKQRADVGEVALLVISDAGCHCSQLLRVDRSSAEEAV